MATLKVSSNFLDILRLVYQFSLLAHLWTLLEMEVSSRTCVEHLRNVLEKFFYQMLACSPQVHGSTARINGGAVIAVSRILVLHLLFVLALAKVVLLHTLCAGSSSLTRLQGWQPTGKDSL